MKISNKVSYLAIILILSSCTNLGGENYEQKTSESCPTNTQKIDEINIIHKSFLERINPINMVAPIFYGIITDINNIKNELDKGNQPNEENRVDNVNSSKTTNCSAQNVK